MSDWHKPVRLHKSSPLYKQIVQLLLSRLQAGEFKPGGLIPSEQELAQQFQVSAGTVRKAIDALVADKVLTRHQGKGTYVATQQQPEVRYRFLRIASDTGAAPKRTATRFLSCQTLPADAHWQAIFGLQAGDCVVRLSRVMDFHQVPTVYEDIYLPEPLFRGLDLVMLNQQKMPLYTLFERVFEVHVLNCDEKLQAINADADLATHLGIAPGQAILSVERRSYSFTQQVVEVRHGFYLTDRFYYSS